MQRHVGSCEEYLQAVPFGQLPLVEHLRSLIRQAAPTAKEEIRYGMLCYDQGGLLFGLGAQKHFVGLYVMATQSLKDMAEELRTIDHGKGCLRFKSLSDVPTPTIRKLLVHARSSRERACKEQQ